MVSAKEVECEYENVWRLHVTNFDISIIVSTDLTLQTSHKRTKIIALLMSQYGS